jgi:hypothetical protein
MMIGPTDAESALCDHRRQLRRRGVGGVPRPIPEGFGGNLDERLADRDERNCEPLAPAGADQLVRLFEDLAFAGVEPLVGAPTEE